MKKLYTKYKELISYIFWGVLTTVVNYVAFWCFLNLLGVNYLVSNVIAWIIAVAFAYITNKVFVFQAKDLGFKNVMREIIEFVASRLFSLFLEMVILYVFVDQFLLRSDIVKIFTNILVIIINYVLSKFIIFREHHSKKNRDEN